MSLPDDRFRNLDVRNQIMRTQTLPGVVLAIGCLMIMSADSAFSQNAAASDEAAVNERAAEQEKQEAAIRATVDKFTEAYNAHNAEAVAALFAPQAQIVDDDGNTVQGHDNIQALFADVFAEQPETGIEVQIESIRFIGTQLALETGTTVTVPPEGQTPESGRYSVLHVLMGGKWQMALVRDLPDEPTHRDRLEALAWLVGDWVDESPEGRVTTSCRWSDDSSFLLQEISVYQAGEVVMKVSQRIGWDPLRKQFRAWVFDAEGGFGESFWTQTETGWLIRISSVNTDGTLASATNHIEPTGLDRYVFLSADRVSGDEVLPPVKVTVVRKPPQPLSAVAVPATK
jgi:uncharacterized protein (TIGR02246 family)